MPVAVPYPPHDKANPSIRDGWGFGNHHAGSGCSARATEPAAPLARIQLAGKVHLHRQSRAVSGGRFPDDCRAWIQFRAPATRLPWLYRGEKLGILRRIQPAPNRRGRGMGRTPQDPRLHQFAPRSRVHGGAAARAQGVVDGSGGPTGRRPALEHVRPPLQGHPFLTAQLQFVQRTSQHHRRRVRARHAENDRGNPRRGSRAPDIFRWSRLGQTTTRSLHRAGPGDDDPRLHAIRAHPLQGGMGQWRALSPAHLARQPANHRHLVVALATGQTPCTENRRADPRWLEIAGAGRSRDDRRDPRDRG